MAYPAAGMPIGGGMYPPPGYIGAGYGGGYGAGYGAGAMVPYRQGYMGGGYGAYPGYGGYAGYGSPPPLAYADGSGMGMGMYDPSMAYYGTLSRNALYGVTH
ncbi:uncharacterized protein EHS24_003569 [Apiotrichum porosum]|uniref:Uncharacterized protein n=1 Tax=Apiotrichum porosum TaxID=105984 RepID=A0A427XED1_9TREE|nr:uncharacterized protein EHS24_003569 [Apiotrichum porosum]RSH77260.1 hypothetical protein EHS24_003569 [Apiotrichum porosum]